MFKYHFVEGYEDALDNLEFPREGEGQTALERFGDDYLLHYMLAFETQGSPSLLDLEMFTNPFTYRMRIRDGDEIREANVDLVETFNFLRGIKVKRVQSFLNNGLSYRVVVGEETGRSVVVIWRDVTGLAEHADALMRDKRFIEDTILGSLFAGDQPNRIFINGPCLVEGCEATEPEFERLMFEELSL